MKVLVTGGCGFIGGRLVESLVARGDHVRILDLAAADQAPPGATLMRGSILDRGDVEAALAGVDRLYHLAGIAHLWSRDPADFDRINRLGTETVLQAASALRTGRVVHCSTESILLPKRVPRHRGARRMVDEAAPPPLADMAGPYTRSKFLGERAALEAARAGLDVVIVNPTVPIGAGDRNMTPPANMLALFLAGGSPFYLDCVLNLVDVRDIAAGIVLAGDRGRAGERYILGGENIALRGLLGRLEALSGRRMPKLPIPRSLALGTGLVAERLARLIGNEPIATAEGVRLAIRSAPFDSDKARRELGYAPRPIDRALEDAVSWLGVEKQLALRPRRLREPPDAAAEPLRS